MKTCLYCVMVVAHAAVLASCARETVSPRAAELTPAAEEFVGLLAQGDFPAAFGKFDQVMRNAMPPDKLKQAWESTQQQAGSFQRQVESRAVRDKGFDIVVVTCQFEKATWDVKVVYDQQGLVTGLWFAPS